MEDKQITNISYDVDPSNFIMFEMINFGAKTKVDRTEMNNNHILGQGRRIIYIMWFSVV